MKLLLKNSIIKKFKKSQLKVARVVNVMKIPPSSSPTKKKEKKVRVKFSVIHTKHFCWAVYKIARIKIHENKNKD